MPRSSIMPFRRTLIAPCAVFLALACKGDATGGAPRRADASGTAGATMESPGEVIIAPAAAKYRVAAVSAPGTVSGTVTFKSALAATPPVSTAGDSSICGASIVADPAVPAGGGQGVVVWLEGVQSGKPLGLERRLELESLNCKLTP